jgi:hypothetical protein
MTYIKALSRKLLLLTLVVVLSNLAILQVLAVTDCLDNAHKRSYVRAGKHIYVRIEKSEFEAMEKQLVSLSAIATRLGDLEKLYLQIKKIIEGIDLTVAFIKKILNIADSDIFKPVKGADNIFKDSSGITMSPGYVEYQGKLNNFKTLQDAFPDNVLDLDIYYNKTLFIIDHIEGKGVLGDKFTKIALSQSLGASRDRIKLPISDALANTVSFKIFLRPVNPLTIEVGNNSKIVAKYNKTIHTGETAPIIYALVPDSPSAIEVRSKT